MKTIQVRKSLTRSIAIACLTAFPALKAATHNFTPSNYTTKLDNITLSDGDTLVFAAGTYTFNPSQANKIVSRSVNLLGAGTKTNGKTKFKSTVANFDRLFYFDTKPNLSVVGIEFLNTALATRNCNNHVINKCRFINSKPRNNTNDTFNLLNAYKGSGAEVKYCYANQTYANYENIKYLKAINYDQVANVVVRNNAVSGKLVGGYTIADDNNIEAHHNTATRDAGGPTDGRAYEDHATYHNNIVGLKHYENTMQGWSTEPSGGGLKLKNGTQSDIHHNLYKTSGILVRGVEAGDIDGITNLWIHDNDVKGGDISTYLDFGIATAVRIERNTVDNGTIACGRGTGSQFNNTVGLANKPGGIYNNTTKTAISVPASITAAGNTTF